MLIALSGPPGSGKSTVGLEVSKRLKIPFISAGELFRKMAKERGISVQDLGKLAEADYEIDRQLDSRQLDLAKSHKDAIVESRLCAFKIPADLKILLTAPVEARARRIASREHKSFEQALRETLDRERSERKRYREIYDIDLGDLSVYDLIINTEIFDQNGVVEIVLAGINSRGVMK